MCIRDSCQAYQEGSIHLLPQKAKKLKRKTRYFHFYLFRDAEQQLIIQQRPAKGLWGGLWEIPNKEVEKSDWEKKIDLEKGRYLLEMKHAFTHFDMMINVYEKSVSSIPAWTEGQFISTEEIDIFAFSKAVLNIFERTL